MATQVQFRRGTSGQNDAFTGAIAEITVDTTNSVIRVHNGTTPGGFTGVGTTSTQTLSNKTLNNTTISGNLVPSANLTYNLGSTTGWYNLIYGKSVQAQYADLAENYQADNDYTPGTVLIFGGSHEVTISTVSHDICVAGIVSTNPAHLMNGALTGPNVVPLALQGRVPCRVKGPVNKGTLLVASDIPGMAEACDENLYKPGCVIGKSLEVISEEEIRIIEVVVGRV